MLLSDTYKRVFGLLAHSDLEYEDCAAGWETDGAMSCKGERPDCALGMGSWFVHAKIDLGLRFPNPTSLVHLNL